MSYCAQARLHPRVPLQPLPAILGLGGTGASMHNGRSRPNGGRTKSVLLFWGSAGLGSFEDLQLLQLTQFLVVGAQGGNQFGVAGVL